MSSEKQKMKNSYELFNGDVVKVGDLVRHRDNENFISKVVLNGLGEFCVQEIRDDFIASKFLLDLCSGYWIKIEDNE